MTTGVAPLLKNKTAEFPAGLNDSSRMSPDTGETPPPAPTLRDRLAAIRDRVMEYCVPAGLGRNTDSYRRARLITGFGLLGFVFGCFYAAFYYTIGHVYGAAIITVCSVAVALVPFLLRVPKS